MDRVARALSAVAALSLLLASACGRPAPAPASETSLTPLPGGAPAATSSASPELRDAYHAHGLGWVFDGRLFVTQDFGGHWKPIALPDGIQEKFPPAIEMVDPSTGFLAWIASAADGTIAIAHTTNAGATWSMARVTVKAQMAHGVRLSFGDARRGWLTVDEQQTMNTPLGELFETDDSGTTWHPRHAASGQMLFLASGRGFANPSHSAQPLTTPDGGLSWVPMADGPAYGLPTFVDGRHGYWGLGGRAYATADGGATWTAAGNLPSKGSDPVLAPAGSTRWFEVTFNPPELWESRDSGQHWAQVAGAGFAAGSDGVWFEGDSGWAFSRHVGSCTGFKTGCSTHAVLLKTRDGGKSWSPVSSPA